MLKSQKTKKGCMFPIKEIKDHDNSMWYVMLDWSLNWGKNCEGLSQLNKLESK